MRGVAPLNQEISIEILPAEVTLPPTPTHVDPPHPEVVDLVTKKGKSGNECHDLLIKTAWT